MNERISKAPREYQRAQRRSEVYGERIKNYRINGSISQKTWNEAVKAQKGRAKSVRAFSRLDRQLQGFAATIPDLSGEVPSLENAVVLFTRQDDSFGLDGYSSVAYEATIGELRNVKSHEEERHRIISGFEDLHAQAERLQGNKRLFINKKNPTSCCR